MKLGEYLIEKVCHEELMAMEFVYEIYDKLSEENFDEAGILEFVSSFGKKETKMSAPMQENQEIWTVGRDLENDICIPDMTVSRKHVRIFFERGQYFIMDLSSLNGTTLNKQPLSAFQKKVCRNHDILELAKCRFRLELEPGGEIPLLVECDRKLSKFRF